MATKMFSKRGYNSKTSTEPQNIEFSNGTLKATEAKKKILERPPKVNCAIEKAIAYDNNVIYLKKRIAEAEAELKVIGPDSYRLSVELKQVKSQLQHLLGWQTAALNIVRDDNVRIYKGFEKLVQSEINRINKQVEESSRSIQSADQYMASLPVPSLLDERFNHNIKLNY